MGGIVSGGLTAGALVATGAYVIEQSSRPSVPKGPASNTLAIVGTASDGPVNVPVPIAMLNGSGPLLAKFGTKTTLANSVVRAALSAAPECVNFVFVRVTDSTETAATLNLQDSVPATVLTLTSLTKGSEANAMTARIDLQSGSATAGPIYRITINYPNNNPIVYANIVASTTSSGPYDAPTFKANALAAINGTAPNSVASPFVVAASGASTAAPVVGVNTTATGGTDGATTITSATLEGTDGSSNRTGMYALRGTSFGGLILAGNTDLTAASVVTAFLSTVGGIGFGSLPSGTTTTAAVASKATNNVSNPRFVLCQDWAYVNDPLSKNPQMLVDPAAMIAGIVMAQPPYLDPANKPVNGKTGINGTERTVNAQPVDPLSEGAQRESNGIMWLTNQMPRGGGFFGLPHGQASDGSNIADTRMLDFIGVQVLQILGLSVGEMQTPPPSSGADNDVTRNTAQARLNAFFGTLRPAAEGAANPMIYKAAIRYTGTLTQVQQGYLPFAIDVTTLSGVKYALATLQVGNTVWIPASN